jgi:hypothetical protein
MRAHVHKLSLTDSRVNQSSHASGGNHDFDYLATADACVTADTDAPGLIRREIAPDCRPYTGGNINP